MVQRYRPRSTASDGRQECLPYQGISKIRLGGLLYEHPENRASIDNYLLSFNVGPRRNF
jgi:hypothetical protein